MVQVQDCDLVKKALNYEIQGIMAHTDHSGRLWMFSIFIGYLCLLYVSPPTSRWGQSDHENAKQKKQPKKIACNKLDSGSRLDGEGILVSCSSNDNKMTIKGISITIILLNWNCICPTWTQLWMHCISTVDYQNNRRWGSTPADASLELLYFIFESSHTSSTVVFLPAQGKVCR